MYPTDRRKITETKPEIGTYETENETSNFISFKW